jgi:hypothetical protein
MLSGVWMHEAEKAIIEKYLTQDTVMMEWGSGGSTVEYSKRVKKYYSVEHNFDWYQKVKVSVGANVTLFYRPVTKLPPDEPHYNQSTYEYYQEYLDVVYEIGEMFDVVLIDGRARRLCALKIIPYLKPNATVIIHDWCLRPCYHCVLDYYDLVEKIDDTAQTIASFKLKPNWKDIKGYDINLGTFERLNG